MKRRWRSILPGLLLALFVALCAQADEADITPELSCLTGTEFSLHVNGNDSRGFGGIEVTNVLELEAADVTCIKWTIRMADTDFNGIALVEGDPGEDGLPGSTVTLLPKSHPKSVKSTTATITAQAWDATQPIGDPATVEYTLSMVDAVLPTKVDYETTRFILDLDENEDTVHLGLPTITPEDYAKNPDADFDIVCLSHADFAGFDDSGWDDGDFTIVFDEKDVYKFQVSYWIYDNVRVKSETIHVSTEGPDIKPKLVSSGGLTHALHVKGKGETPLTEITVENEAFLLSKVMYIEWTFKNSNAKFRFRSLDDNLESGDEGLGNAKFTLTAAQYPTVAASTTVTLTAQAMDFDDKPIGTPERIVLTVRTVNTKPPTAIAYDTMDYRINLGAGERTVSLGMPRITPEDHAHADNISFDWRAADTNAIEQTQPDGAQNGDFTFKFQNPGMYAAQVVYYPYPNYPLESELITVEATGDGQSEPLAPILSDSPAQDIALFARGAQRTQIARFTLENDWYLWQKLGKTSAPVQWEATCDDPDFAVSLIPFEPDGMRMRQSGANVSVTRFPVLDGARTTCTVKAWLGENKRLACARTFDIVIEGGAPIERVTCAPDKYEIDLNFDASEVTIDKPEIAPASWAAKSAQATYSLLCETPNSADFESLDFTGGNHCTILFHAPGTYVFRVGYSPYANYTVYSNRIVVEAYYGEPPETVQAILIEAPENAVWNAGEVMQLDLRIEPDWLYADEIKFVWKSSDTRIATVDDKGLLRLKSKGSVTISAAAQDGGKAVGKRTFDITALIRKLTIPSATVYVGHKVTLEPTFFPENPENRELTWAITPQAGDTPGAAIFDTAAGDDKIGKIKGIAPGTITVTATSRYGYDGELSVPCRVTVKDMPQSITVARADGETNNLLNVGGAPAAFTATVAGSAGVIPISELPPIAWSTSNAKIAQVDRDGRVTARKPGSVYIIATAMDGSGIVGKYKAQALVPVDSIDITNKSFVLLDRTVKLAANVSPKNATDKQFAWSVDTDSANLVSIDGKNTLKGVSLGKALIRATAANGVVATQWMHVVHPADSVVIENAPVDPPAVRVRDRLSLRADAFAGGVKQEFDGSIVWKSMTPKIAKVDQAGNVTFLKAGTAKIRASAASNAKTNQEIAYRVSRAASVKLNKAALYLTKDSDAAARTLKATVSPKDAAIVWSIGANDQNITVTASGATGEIHIPPTFTGTARVTVMAQADGASAACAVHIAQNAITRIALTPQWPDERGYLLTKERLRVDIAITPEPVAGAFGANDLIWKSSKPKVANVQYDADSGQYYIVGNKAGTTTITATSPDGAAVGRIEKLSVKAGVSKVGLNPSSMTIYRNGPDSVRKLTAKLSASKKALGKEIANWSVDANLTGLDGEPIQADPASYLRVEACVNSKNKTTAFVYARKDCIALVRATAPNGVFGTCRVAIKTLPDAMTIGAVGATTATLELLRGRKLDLTSDLALTGGSSRDALLDEIQWKTSNKKIASVANGVVKTGKKMGLVTITATLPREDLTVVWKLRVVKVLSKRVTLDAGLFPDAPPSDEAPLADLPSDIETIRASDDEQISEIIPIGD